MADFAMLWGVCVAKPVCVTPITLSPHKPMCVCVTLVWVFFGKKCFGGVCVTARRHLDDLATFGGEFVFKDVRAKIFQSIEFF